jgi:hypothetical protein
MPFLPQVYSRIYAGKEIVPAVTKAHNPWYADLP